MWSEQEEGGMVRMIWYCHGMVGEDGAEDWVEDLKEVGRCERRSQLEKQDEG